ncbi:hypothetical protein K505DRAFT_368997 [Melanomma pulvis-pyrius CBS 109.77]|uniref:Uncharacterized protein n=1 Tax=Melanomma pulvis-pyrius CBS 109.77 TaxID=1314802 RepID=A0A6A6WNG3_9PLEO|nr:hypothetical protein K505DRAFT_368997 [Melanomma pulvis-pyrius CBS 109.77]
MAGRATRASTVSPSPLPPALTDSPAQPAAKLDDDEAPTWAQLHAVHISSRSGDVDTYNQLPARLGPPLVPTGTLILEPASASLRRHRQNRCLWELCLLPRSPPCPLAPPVVAAPN